MDWWKLIDFDNPDNEFSVVRNIYRSVSVSRIEIEALSPRVTTMMKVAGYKPPIFITILYPEHGGSRFSRNFITGYQKTTVSM